MLLKGPKGKKLTLFSLRCGALLFVCIVLFSPCFQTGLDKNSVELVQICPRSCIYSSKTEKVHLRFAYEP